MDLSEQNDKAGFDKNCVWLHSSYIYLLHILPWGQTYGLSASQAQFDLGSPTSDPIIFLIFASYHFPKYICISLVSAISEEEAAHYFRISLCGKLLLFTLGPYIY